MKSLILYLISVLGYTPYLYAQLTLTNPSFETQMLAKYEQSDAGDIFGWDASGRTYVHYLDPHYDTGSIVPYAQDGNNTCILNEALDEPVYIQQIVMDGNTPVTVKADHTYKVSVWVGRLRYTLEENVGILEVYLKEAQTGRKIARTTYDLQNQIHRSWTFQTFELSTASHPPGLGSWLILGFENTGSRNKETPEYLWQGQIVLDEVDITRSDPKIIFVTDSPDINADRSPTDQAWIDWLITEGYDADARPNHWIAPLDANHIADLENAHLIIAGPGLHPDLYHEPNQAGIWNGMTTPILNLNKGLLGKNQWNWIDSNDPVEEAGLPLMEPQDINHPVFSGIVPDQSGLVDILDPNVGSESICLFDNILDMGNGTLLGRALGTYDTAWVAEWADGVEFYDGAGEFTGGHRMMFIAGARDVPSGRHEFYLNASGRTMLHNMIAYLVSQKKNGPVLELTFDDGTGSDTSGHRRDVTLYGDAAVVDDPQRGKVLQLGGTGFASRALEDNGDLICRDSVTVAFWIKETASPVVPVGVFGNGYHSRHAFTVLYKELIDGSGNTMRTFAWYIRGSTIPFSYRDRSIPDGVWCHMAFTYDNHTGGRIYLNGEMVSERSATGGLLPPDEGGINVGNTIDPYYPPFAGFLDQIVVYDRVLSEDEIAALADM